MVFFEDDAMQGSDMNTLVYYFLSLFFSFSIFTTFPIVIYMGMYICIYVIT